MVETKPTAGQMFELQGMADAAALAQDKLKFSRKSNDVYFFLPKEISGFKTGEANGQEYYWTHRFLGRVARLGDNRWRMRLLDKHCYKPAFRDTDEADAVGINAREYGYRADYVFEWDNSQVFVASKKIDILSADAAIILCENDGNLTSVEQQAPAPPWPTKRGQPRPVAKADLQKLLEGFSGFTNQSTINHLNSFGRAWNPWEHYYEQDYESRQQGLDPIS